MATTPASNTEEIERIRGEMAQIRLDLHENVQGAVEGARALADVSSHLKNHFWTLAGVAAVVGFWLVPRRAPDPAPTKEEVRETVQSVMTRRDKAKAATTQGGGLGTLFSLVAPIAARVAQGYAVGLVEDWLGSRAQGSPAEPPRPGAEPGPQGAVRRG
jgi:hypothetical protein